MLDRHEGRQTHYSARLGALVSLIDWVRQMSGVWHNRFDRPEDLLKRMGSMNERPRFFVSLEQVPARVA